MTTHKSLAEKLRIIEDMEDYLKVILGTDDVQIIADIELGDDDEGLQEDAKT